MEIKTVKDLKEFIKDFSDDTQIFFQPDDYDEGRYGNDFYTVADHFKKQYIKEYQKEFLKNFKKYWHAKNKDIIIKLYW